MDAEFSIELRDAFIAQPEDMRKIAKLLSDRIGLLEINADCADGINRKFPTVTELLQFENSLAKSITRLRISARSEDYKKRGEIDLSDSRWRGISIKLQAREDVVGRLKEELLDTVAAMRPAYSWLHKSDFVFVCLGIVMALSLLPAVLIAFDFVRVSDSASLTARSAARGTLIGLLMPAIAVMFGMIFNRSRNRFFPRAFFAIGLGVRRLVRLERIQWSIIIGFLVSFAASVVVAIWQAWMA